MKAIQNLLESTVEQDLCCRCGVCVGVCPKKIIDLDLKSGNPYCADITQCVDCGLCSFCCPANGYEIDTPRRNNKNQEYYKASSNEDSIRDKASSGGFVTQLLLDLLDEKVVDQVIVVQNSESIQNELAKYLITDKREDILNAQQSKYVQVPIGKAISAICENEYSRYAVVALPCQMYGFYRAMQKLPILKQRIVLTIGMFCGYTYTNECINGLASLLNSNKDNLCSIVGWREGGLPGHFTVKNKENELLSIPFIDEHSVDVTFYAQNRCLLCKDCLCEYADIVVGDIGKWSSRNTLVIPRSQKAHEIISLVKSRQSIDLEPLNIEEINKSVLNFMLSEKRSKVTLRIKRYKNRKRNVPNWTNINEPKLMYAQKLSTAISQRLQDYGRGKVAYFQKNPRKMLIFGRIVYYKLPSFLLFKILFKMEQVCKKFLKKYINN